MDEQSVTDGLVVAAGGTDLTFSRTIFSDSDGGTFDIVPGRSADFISFEETTSGAHTGYIEMTFDNENDDPTDYVELTINFAQPVTNLQFSILDMDGNGNFAWDDAAEIFYNGINVKTDPNLYQIGSVIFLDNETYMDGFEAGNQGASANQTRGNIDFDFGSELVNNITVRYFTTDDARANPAAQFIGISDLQFVTAVPEPSAVVLIVAAGILGLTRRRRRIAC